MSSDKNSQGREIHPNSHDPPGEPSNSSGLVAKNLAQQQKPKAHNEGQNVVMGFSTSASSSSSSSPSSDDSLALRPLASPQKTIEKRRVQRQNRTETASRPGNMIPGHLLAKRLLVHLLRNRLSDLLSPHLWVRGWPPLTPSNCPTNQGDRLVLFLSRQSRLGVHSRMVAMRMQHTTTSSLCKALTIHLSHLEALIATAIQA